MQVAGQTLQMRLPGNIRSGDVLELEVIATQPRITFSMVASTNPLSTPEQIGATARILSNLAELPIERLIVQQPGNKAVWQAGQQVPDTRQLAGALRDALGKSGLFYESHQAQWIRGERSINQLLEEPQNLLMEKNLPLSYGDQRTTSATQAQSNTPVTSRPASDASLPIAKELLLLVQQQLHTLEHHHLAWMGQVWPGQEMQWEIQGQPEHQTQQQDERQWSTEMELALPKLGDVHARLVFAESGLRLTLQAADSATVDLFSHALPQLRNSLADTDIALLAAVVEKS
ncbi:MAG: flagellar hook-length control protein FliK [Gallionella sp.]|nr:flagellar hook-length control protein FliK [Gallionella sp.]